MKMEHVGVVVDDLHAAIVFFVELGLGLEDETSVSGQWVDRIVGLDDVLTRLYAHGARLVGELVQYEDRYRLCYVRGPAGIIVELAETLT